MMAGDVLITISCLKLIVMWFNAEDFRYLLRNMSEDWNITAEYNQRIMRENSKINEIIVKIMVSGTHGTALSYGLLNIFIVNADAGKIDESNNRTISKQLLLISKFIFDAQERPIFEICWIGQLTSGLICASAFTAFDSFFLLSMLHACGQLTILEYDLKNAITIKHSLKLSFKESLGICARKHDKIYRFIQCIERISNKIFLVGILGFSLTFCLQAFQAAMIMTGESPANLFKITFITVFLISNLGVVFVYCFITEMLHEKCINIFYAPYDTDWYNLKTSEAKLLLNVMYRAKVLPKVTAGKFFQFSMAYFMTCMKTSLGYVSMLFTIKNQLQV